MRIDKSKLKLGIWYEDKDGNYIPSTEDVDAPEDAVTCHVCFPLQIRTEHYRIKPHTDPDGNVHRTYHGSDRFLTTSCHIGGGNEPVILAMVSSGDFTLSEALAAYANCCERCANVLAHKYLNGKDGYPEFSSEWFRCGTVCDYCRDTTINNESLEVKSIRIAAAESSEKVRAMHSYDFGGIERQQAIKAEPVCNAHWVNDTFCSNCNRFPVYQGAPISNQKLTKYFSYCPHCGAKMIGGTDRCSDIKEELDDADVADVLDNESEDE